MKQHPITFGPGLFCILCMVFLPAIAFSGQISGNYRSTSGNNIVLEMTVSAPAPQSIIIVQSVTGTTRIKGATPSPQKIAGAGQTAKWLLKDIQPGVRRIQLQLSGPLQGSLQAHIRYRSADGHLQECVVVAP